MILKLNPKLWTERIRPRFEQPPYSYAKKRGIVNVSLPNITRFCNILYTQKVRTYLTIHVSKLPRLYTLDNNNCGRCQSYNSLVSRPREAICVCCACGETTACRYSDEGSYTQSLGMAQANLRRPSILPRQHSSNIYKRCNHFRNWLKRIQGKERNKMCRDDLEKIKRRIDMLRLEDLTYHQVQDVLRDLHMQHLYTHIYTIIQEVTGTGRFQLENEHEERLVRRFLELQEAFAKFTPRPNMLSYVYIITKISELEGWESMSEELPRFKSTKKLRDADKIWERVCNHLNWRFIPSRQ